MAVAKDTTSQNYYDGFGKGLPVGIRDYDTEGKAMLVVSSIQDAAPVAGSTAFDPATGNLTIYDGTNWLTVTLK